MRRFIETAPRDGTFVILEEDASGKYKIACWSPEARGWVDESDKPIKITPAYWHTMHGTDLQQETDPSFHLRCAASDAYCPRHDCIAYGYACSSDRCSRRGVDRTDRNQARLAVAVEVYGHLDRGKPARRGIHKHLLQRRHYLLCQANNRSP